MNGLSKWKVAFYLAGIFLSGGVSGWVVATKMDRQKAFKPLQTKEIAVSLRDRLHARLNLTPEQAQKVDAIIDRSSAEMGAIHAENTRRIRQGLSSRNAQIRAALTPEQQKQFEQIEKERQESWRAKEGSRGKSRGHDRGEIFRDKRSTNTIGKQSVGVATNALPEEKP